MRAGDRYSLNEFLVIVRILSHSEPQSHTQVISDICQSLRTGRDVGERDFPKEQPTQVHLSFSVLGVFSLVNVS